MRQMMAFVFLISFGSALAQAGTFDQEVALQNDCGMESQFAESVAGFRDKGATLEQETRRLMSFGIPQTKFALSRQKSELSDIEFVFQNPALSPSDLQQQIFYLCKNKASDPDFYAGKDQATFH